MNKELETLYTPLQCLNNIRDNYFLNKSGTKLEYLWFNRIETALKNYEEGLYHAKTYVKHTSSQALYDLLGLALKNVHRSFWKLPEQLYDDVNKSLKALEIIKEKKIDVNVVIYYLKMEVSDDQVCHWYNDCMIDADEEPERVLYEEDLICLKEVLL